MRFRYNPDKDFQLLMERGVGFEEIIEAITSGNLVKTRKHHNQKKYPEQEIMHVICLGQIYLVPHVIEQDGTVFLKTLYPSGKVTKQYIDKELSKCKTPSSVLEKLV